jgi:hypothetical protein
MHGSIQEADDVWYVRTCMRAAPPGNEGKNMYAVVRAEHVHGIAD